MQIVAITKSNKYNKIYEFSVNGITVTSGKVSAIKWLTKTL